MRTFTRFIPILISIGAAGSAWADAVVVVAEDGGFDPSTVQTVRTIASSQLRVRGVEVSDDPGYHTTVPVTDSFLQTVAERGAERLFVLRLGRLGEKVLISMEEIQAPVSTPLFVATLTAETIEEADTVVPRLVQAVLGRVPAEKTATITTMTAQESKEFRKRPGEGLWMLGLAVAPLGGSFGWSYEAEKWRLGSLFQGAEDDPSFFGLEGAWVPFVGNISPYAGAGIGVVWPPTDVAGDAKLGAKVDLGVEFFRLHGTRLLVGASAVIPLGSMPHVDDANPELWLRLGL